MIPALIQSICKPQNVKKILLFEVGYGLHILQDTSIHDSPGGGLSQSICGGGAVTYSIWWWGSHILYLGSHTLPLVMGQSHTPPGGGTVIHSPWWWAVTYSTWWWDSHTLPLVMGQSHTPPGGGTVTHSPWWLGSHILPLVVEQSHTP